MKRRQINTKDIDALLEESIKNVRLDRASVNTALMPLLQHLQGQVERNERIGLIVAKYLETLQRSNEQLIKIAELTRKRQGGGSIELSSEDKEDLFDEINQDIESLKEEEE